MNVIGKEKDIGMREAITPSPSLTDLSADIRTFATTNSLYYEKQFRRFEEVVDFAWTFNWAAALLGPVWMAARGLWVLFWIFALLETFAIVQLSSGVWADLGAAELARSERLAATAKQRLEESRQPAVAGTPAQVRFRNRPRRLRARREWGVNVPRRLPPHGHV
jgi:Protein of unknown function (DUF2628)